MLPAGETSRGHPRVDICHRQAHHPGGRRITSLLQADLRGAWCVEERKEKCSAARRGLPVVRIPTRAYLFILDVFNGWAVTSCPQFRTCGSWNCGTCQSLKVLRSKGLSPEPIIEWREGKEYGDSS